MIIDKLARSPRKNSEGLYSGTQTVMEHCYNVAITAKMMGRNNEEAKKLFILGLFHDIGKYAPDFQSKIRGRHRESFSHPTYSAIAFMSKWVKYDDIISNLIIDGHHIGLQNADDFSKNLEPYFTDKNKDSILNEIYNSFNKDLSSIGMSLDKVQLMPSQSFRKEYNSRQLCNLETMGRYYFSALVDADHTDAERASDYRKHLLRDERETSLDDLISNYDAYNDAFARTSFFGGKIKLPKIKDNSKIINKYRRDIRDKVIDKASDDVDFGVLDVLTGLGKTNTMIGYGLNYMKHHEDKKKLIFVVPFISIIEQFEKLFESIFGTTDKVLSHHSNDSIKEGDAYYDEKMCAIENYFGYTIIITTYVQFFGTIFSNKAGKLKKFHNFADSVVMFDEFHTIPFEMTQIYLEMLQNMNEKMNCSFVFSSATIPNLVRGKFYENGIPANKLTYLYDNSREVFETINRVEYEIMGTIEDGSMFSYTDDYIAGKVAKEPESTLVIVNTKKVAYELYEKVKLRSDRKVYFLSGWKTKHDNQLTIGNIKDSLKNGENIICVSTQIIEAGVDVDFPVVYRHIAPLEAILQTAGRCNREFNTKKKGKINIFSLENAPMPYDDAYKRGTKATIRFLENGTDILNSYDGFTKYYNFFKNIGFYKDTNDINKLREKFRYEEVAEKVYVINTESIGVVILNDITMKVINGKKWLNREDKRKVAPYEIALFPHEVALLEKNKVINKWDCGSLVWEAEYSFDEGISKVICGAKELSPKAIIV